MNTGVPIQVVQDVPLSAFGVPFLASLFTSRGGSREVLVLRLGSISDEDECPVRIHSSCLPGEVLASDRCDCGWQLRHAVELIASYQRGVIIYLLAQDGRGAGLSALLRSYRLTDIGLSSADAFSELGEVIDRRDYGEAVTILQTLAVPNIALITNNPNKENALRAGGLNIVKRIPSIIPPAEPGAHSLNEKRLLGHVIGEGRS